jgi:hypothetical protein
VSRRTTATPFGPLLAEVARQAGLARAREGIGRGAGAPGIGDLADDPAPRAGQLGDLWQAKQPVWKVAPAACGRGTAAGAAWAQDACTTWVQGQSTTWLQRLLAVPPLAPPAGQRRSVPAVEADYFTRTAARRRSPGLRAQGRQGGRGSAEAAGKTVVRTRARRSGRRWTPVGRERLLALRTAVLNDSYDAFWQTQTGGLA